MRPIQILHKIYDDSVSPELILGEKRGYNLRGNTLNLKKLTCLKNQRLNAFPLRVTNIWNSLPNEVVEAPSVNSFKNRLDKHWKNQEVIFDYKAELNIRLPSKRTNPDNQNPAKVEELSGQRAHTSA